MDKSQLNKVLGLIKFYLKNEKPTEEYSGNPYFVTNFFISSNFLRSLP